jgi:hypothetical protein
MPECVMYGTQSHISYIQAYIIHGHVDSVLCTYRTTVHVYKIYANMTDMCGHVFSAAV